MDRDEDRIGIISWGISGLRTSCSTMEKHREKRKEARTIILVLIEDAT